MRIVVCGMIAGTPHQGGATWALLQYVLGLRRLGHDVFLIEPIRDACTSDFNACKHYLRSVASSFGLEDRCALLMRESGNTAGMSYLAVRDALASADLLLNFSGLLRDAELLQLIPVRAYIDLDPGFTQLWQEVQGIDMGLDGHTHFVTVGPLIGSEVCPVPTGGQDWIGTLQPIVLSYWPVAGEIRRQAYTTIANWRGYGSIEYQGKLYGQKAHSLRALIEAPKASGERFELALSIHPNETPDLDALNQNDWVLLDPVAEAGTPEAYRQFVAGSRAEFAFAKSGYVHGRTGWFSDRSVCYLACGRPVLAQETGFSSVLPTGEGLLAFDDIEGIVEGTQAIRRDYGRHASRARELAEVYFDSDRVLTLLLERLRT